MQPPAPEVHVVISTHAPRRAWLAQLLDQLGRQTLVPDRVVILDDPPEGDEIDTGRPFAMHVVHHAERLGPAARWRHVAEHPYYAGEGANVIIVALDDDVQIGPRYVELSVRWCQEAGAAISWWPLTDDEIAAHAPGVEIPWLAGGMTTLRARWLRGLTRLSPDLPRVERHLRFGKSCDAFLSWFLWWRGIPIVRPATSGLREHVALRETPGSYVEHYGPGLTEQVADLERTGWVSDANPRRLDGATEWPG